MEGKVNMENMEVLRVDEFKYLESNHQTVHKRGEEESAGRLEWAESGVICNQRIAAGCHVAM